MIELKITCDKCKEVWLAPKCEITSSGLNVEGMQRFDVYEERVVTTPDRKVSYKNWHLCAKCANGLSEAVQGASKAAVKEFLK